MSKATNETLSERRLNILASRLSAMSATMRDARKVAYELAQAGDRDGVFQLRGAFMGTLEAAKTTDGFLAGLREMFD